MPYSLPNNIPDSIKNLPQGAKTIWVNTFNAVVSDGGSEDDARKAAWSNVKNKYKKEGGKWVKKKYTNQNNLPADVLKLPDLGQKAWMLLYNQQESFGKSDSESSKYAWDKVKQKFQQNDKGVWEIKKSKEIIMKTFLNNNSEKGLFKVFVPFSGQEGEAVILEKDIGGHKRKFLKGIASSTLVDKEDERVSKSFLNKMKSVASGMTVFAEHEHHLDSTVGYVDDVGGNEDTFEVMTALEKEWHPENNPTGNQVVTKILNKLEDGVKLGYSIGGRVTKAKKVFDEDLQKEVNELEDGELYEVTVTAMPAGNNTFVQPLMKSMKEILTEDNEYTDDIPEETEEPVGQESVVNKTFEHNSNFSDKEPSWGTINKRNLPAQAFVNESPGFDLNKSVSWEYPHHHVVDEKLYLHKGGLVTAWLSLNKSNIKEEKVKQHLVNHLNEIGITEKHMDTISDWYLNGRLDDEQLNKLFESFSTISHISEESDLQNHISKTLDEMVEASNVHNEMYDLFWSFKSAIYEIMGSETLAPEEKKNKINNLSTEFGDKVEGLSARLAELTSIIDEAIH